MQTGMGITSYAGYPFTLPVFALGTVAAFPDIAIKCTKEVSYGDRYTDCLFLLTESRLENRAISGFAKFFWSLE